jgi:Holliday junction resolvase
MSYEKGARRERELIELLERERFVVVRSAGSGKGGKKVDGEEREQPDLLAGNGDVFFAIESKAEGSDTLYISKEEVSDLEYFAKQFGAKARVAVRFDYKDFYFFKREEMHETEKSYRMKKENIDKGEKVSDIVC